MNMVLQFLKALWWRIMGNTLGWVAPGVVVSRCTVGRLSCLLRVDGWVVMTDHKGISDALPITMVSEGTILALVNACRWPWQPEQKALS